MDRKKIAGELLAVAREVSRRASYQVHPSAKTRPMTEEAMDEVAQVVNLSLNGAYSYLQGVKKDLGRSADVVEGSLVSLEFALIGAGLPGSEVEAARIRKGQKALKSLRAAHKLMEEAHKAIYTAENEIAGASKEID